MFVKVTIQLNLLLLQGWTKIPPPRGFDNRYDTAMSMSILSVQSIRMGAYLVCTRTRISTCSSTMDVIAVWRVFSTKPGYDVPSSDLIGIRVCVVCTDLALYGGLLVSILMQRSAWNNLENNSQQKWWAAHGECNIVCVKCVYRYQSGHTWESDYIKI
jgi:hypothetical protein